MYKFGGRETNKGQKVALEVYLECQVGISGVEY